MKFVKDFLKEINDIEDINSRFQTNMNEKISETMTRYGPEGQPIYGSIDAVPSSTAKDFAYRPISQTVLR